MKLKQYIAELQEILEEEGDIDVMTNYNGVYLTADPPDVVDFEDINDKGKLVCIV
jgi:hypothetical protein